MEFQQFCVVIVNCTMKFMSGFCAARCTNISVSGLKLLKIRYDSQRLISYLLRLIMLLILLTLDNLLLNLIRCLPNWFEETGDSRHRQGRLVTKCRVLVTFQSAACMFDVLDNEIESLFLFCPSGSTDWKNKINSLFLFVCLFVFSHFSWDKGWSS